MLRWETIAVSISLIFSTGPGIACEPERADHCPHCPPVGVVEGRVYFAGEIPLSETPDNSGRKLPLLEVDRRSGGLRYAVAHMVPMDDANEAAEQGGSRPPQPSPMPGIDREAAPLTIDQIDHRFVPRVVAIRSGTVVKFTNSDPANHNVRSVSLDARNEFNVFTGAGSGYEHNFYAYRALPVRIGCDIHPWMRAWIYPFNHDRFAVTDKSGRFRISDIPAGRYRLVVRQPDVGFKQELPVTVVAGKTQSVQVRFRDE